MARLLIPSLPPLVDAMTWAAGHLETAADALWVDDYLLTVRLRSLSDRERSDVNRLLTNALP